MNESHLLDLIVWMSALELRCQGAIRKIAGLTNITKQFLMEILVPLLWSVFDSITVVESSFLFLQNNQNALRLLLEAAKVSEQKMDAVIAENKGKDIEFPWDSIWIWTLHTLIKGRLIIVILGLDWGESRLWWIWYMLRSYDYKVIYWVLASPSTVSWHVEVILRYHSLCSLDEAIQGCFLFLFSSNFLTLFF